MRTARELSLSMLRFFDGQLKRDADRWGTLVEFPNLLEGWWKGEFASALVRWTEAEERGDDWFAVGLEQKPGNRPWRDGKDGRTCDLVVYRYDSEKKGYAPTLGGPRVWFEVKHRTMAWGGAKAFGSANRGVLHDIEKWRGFTLPMDEDALAVMCVGDSRHSDELNPAWEAQVKAAGPLVHRSVHSFTGHGGVQRRAHVLAWDLLTPPATPLLSP